MKYVFVAIILSAFMACNHMEKHAEQLIGETMGDSTKEAGDSMKMTAPEITVLHYAGVIPCADCEGIETEISLKSDRTYLVHSLYLGRKSTGAGSNEISETGEWMQHGASMIHLMDRKNAPAMFEKTDSTLTQLDMGGKKITGKLADKYILKKK